MGLLNPEKGIITKIWSFVHLVASANYKLKRYQFMKVVSVLYICPLTYVNCVQEMVKTNLETQK